MIENMPPCPNAHNVNFVNLDPREEYLKDRLVPKIDLKDARISPNNFQTTKMACL